MREISAKALADAVQENRARHEAAVGYCLSAIPRRWDWFPARLFWFKKTYKRLMQRKAEGGAK